MALRASTSDFRQKRYQPFWYHLPVVREDSRLDQLVTPPDKMNDTGDNDKQFFSDFTASATEISRSALIMIVVVCFASTGADIAAWAWGKSLPFLPLTFAAFVPAYVGAIYLAVMSILSRWSTFPGYLRFLATTVLTFAPFGIAVGAYYATPDQAVPIIVVIVIIGIIAIIMLPAWPAAQALCPAALSPLRVLKATKGHRWGLILGTSAVSAINKIDMKVAEAGSANEAILGALVAAALGIISTVLLAVLTAMAFRYAVRNDPDLYGSEAQAEGV